MTNDSTWIIYVVIALLLFLWAGESEADVCKENNIAFGGWSYHSTGGDYNQDHKMIGLTCDNWSVINFTNSHYKDSWGVGYTTDPFYNKWGVNVGFYVAAWSGYKDKTGLKSDIVPVGGFRFSKDIKRFRIAVTTAIFVHTLHFEWRIR